MYSPKIAEDLVPLLYIVAKARGIPMTRLVNEILREGLERYGDTITVEASSQAHEREAG